MNLKKLILPLLIVTVIEWGMVWYFNVLKQQRLMEKQEVKVINEVKDVKFDVKVENPKETKKEQPKKVTTKSNNKTQNNVKTTPKNNSGSQSNGTYKLTHYGHDCCKSGKTATGYDVRKTIYYNDKEYGQVRIVAMCKNIPLYSIVKIKNYKITGGDVIAIVIDRGVGCSTIDLLVENEAKSSKLGIQRNTVVEILRKGK